MSVSNPKKLDPVCLNCGHLWSKHFVNDPDLRCSLDTRNPTRESWCGCGGFRMGCAKCNHPMKDHGWQGQGPCHHANVVGKHDCRCSRYEPST